MIKEIDYHKFDNIYKELGVQAYDLGAVLLECNDPKLGDINMRWLADPQNPPGKQYHLTLFEGLLKSAQEWKQYINQVLQGWNHLNHLLIITDVEALESPHKEDYFVIVATIKIDDWIMDGHERIAFLPHINSYQEFVPHVTLAYVKKDVNIKNQAIKFFQDKLVGKSFKIKNINYGR
jgi:hypothetical protein